jgi:hypothetical protein
MLLASILLLSYNYTGFKFVYIIVISFMRKKGSAPAVRGKSLAGRAEAGCLSNVPRLYE